ncbi:TPA: hypothetical protein DCW61_04240 [Candidatus Uhrbacteria bacterium]|nr:hypothetical protein [Candidatus Uhrbacteria bacterium]
MEKNLLDFGTKLLDETRGFILTKIEEGFKKKQKPDNSFVTTVDTGVEDIMRQRIRAAYPDHGIVGEEGGAFQTDAEFIWCIDPIDGTAEFISGLPIYGVLLSLYQKGRPILGMIDHPSLGIRLCAQAGRGSFIDNIPIKITNNSHKLIQKEMFAIGPKFMFEKQDAGQVYDVLKKTFLKIEEIQNCHWHTRLLKGEFAAVVDYGLRSWDISPVQLLVEEAGGKFIEIENRIIDGKDRHAIIFGKPDVVDWIVKLLEAEPS